MISALSWVPKGVAKAVPEELQPPSEEEIQEYLRSRGVDGDHDGSENEESDDNAEEEMTEDAVATARAAASALGASLKKIDISDGLAELDMDNYDDEDDDVNIFGNGGVGAAYYANAEDDPYITNKDDDDEDEIADMTIKQSDFLILAARFEDDVSHLEVWVYEEEDNEDGSNLYVHHDIMLPALPLCLTWLDCNSKGGDKGNFVAIGSRQPEIEIWDVDVLDAVEPVAVLGGVSKEEEDQSNKKKKKKKKKKEIKYKEGSHTDDVLGVAWNSEYRNVLASASADKSVKIWDIVTQKCVQTLNHHTDKVQAVAWNLKNPTHLLSGSFDRTVVMMDMAVPTREVIRWNVPADVECIAWNPHSDISFLVSLEDGNVQAFDVRNTKKSLYTIHAHEKAVSALCYNFVAPNLVATASMDKMVKLWDVSNDSPTCISSLNPKVGAVFSASFCKESPLLLAVAGSKGILHVWDTVKVPTVSNKFGNI